MILHRNDPHDVARGAKPVEVEGLASERTAALVNAEAALRLGREPRWFDLPWFDPIRSEPELVATLRRAGGESSRSQPAHPPPDAGGSSGSAV